MSYTTVTRERKPLPKPKSQPKAIWDSNPDFRINLMCAQCPSLKKCGDESFHWVSWKLVADWEMLINLLKSSIPQWWGKWESDPESVSRTGSPPKLKQFFRLVGPIHHNTKFQWNWPTTFADWRDRITSALAEVIITYKTIKHAETWNVLHKTI